jgi:hypothetical protein
MGGTWFFLSESTRHMGIPAHHMCLSLGGKLSFKELDLRDPCNAATLSRRALCTESPAEQPR